MDHSGWQPAFPEGVSYCLLADLRELNWGIYLFSLDETNEKWKPSNPVSAELSQLIESGRRYPPALAIARDQMIHIFGNRDPTQKEFAEAYGKEICSRLQQQ